MVVSEFVDCVPILGSQRRSYILIGAAFTAAGMLTLAGAADGYLFMARAEQAYVLGALLIVFGTLIQDVVADAMSTEVVERADAAGNPRPEHDVRAELGMVQVLGRLSLSGGMLAVAGLSGWLAGLLARETVFLIGLAIPLLSLVGVFIMGREIAQPRPIDWRILGGGLAFGVVVTALGIWNLPADVWIKAFLGMGLLFSVGSSLSLAKTLRDVHEASRVVARIDEARFHKLVSEHDPLSPPA